MQLNNCTKLERKLYNLIVKIEKDLPAGELYTNIQVAMSDAIEELQRLRSKAERFDAVKHNLTSFLSVLNKE